MTDWVAEYKRKSQCDDDPLAGDDLRFFWPEGFMVVRLVNGDLFVRSAAGQGKFLDEKAKEIAHQLGCKEIFFTTKRSPKAWERRLGYKIAGYILSKEL